jgi:prenyltransferase beta subunit
MDTSCSTEIVQAHLNFIEILYQKSFVQKRNSSFYFRSLKTFEYMKNLFMLYNNKKILLFFKEYFEKIWYFLPSYVKLQNWVFFWSFNSYDLLLKKNTNFSKKYFACCLKNLLKSFANNEYIFNNSNTLLSFYAVTMTYTCIKKKIFKLNRSDLVQIYVFIKKLKNKIGSFQSFFLGESDSRLNYCILIICSLYNILTIEISSNCEHHIRSIQMNDGSFSGNKAREGHVSFFYCCISSLLFFSQKNKLLSVPICFNNWLSQKEKLFEFSIQGRTSKLTDCCYFFWLGASFILGSLYLPLQLLNGLVLTKGEILSGFSDKIGRYLDLYHTCYAICGFSMLNFENRININSVKLKNNLFNKCNKAYLLVS